MYNPVRDTGRFDSNKELEIEMERVRDTALFKKVYGCLIGGAIGDAMGGPVEDREWTPEKLREVLMVRSTA